MASKPIAFELAKSPSMRLASLAWDGAWSESRIHGQFRKLASWARQHRLKTGRWVMEEGGTTDFVVGIEVRGSAPLPNGARWRTLPATRVGRVIYDPDVVSPEVIYHGLSNWLRWRRKEGTIGGIGHYREVYRGDPWTNASAWSHTETQLVVRPARRGRKQR
jgi:hypothetical protein